MDTQLLIIFIVLNILNVIIQRVKSIATVKCGKAVASLVNAVAYGLYTVVTVYMMCELSLGLKALIVALCNLIGVYVVKWAEEKARKDKLWKVEATVNPIYLDKLKNIFEKNGIPFSYIDVNKYVIFNLYCATQKDSLFVKSVLDQHNAKYFVSESKTL
jgi:hypothetical protein